MAHGLDEERVVLPGRFWQHGIRFREHAIHPLQESEGIRLVELNHLRAESVFRQSGNILRAGIVQRLGDPVDGRGIPP